MAFFSHVCDNKTEYFKQDYKMHYWTAKYPASMTYFFVFHNQILRIVAKKSVCYKHVFKWISDFLTCLYSAQKIVYLSDMTTHDLILTLTKMY